MLSTAGDGALSNDLLNNILTPLPYQSPIDFPAGARLNPNPTERPYFPALFQLNNEILCLASEVGQMARKLRATAAMMGKKSTEACFAECRSEVELLQHRIESTRTSLKERFPDYLIWLNTLESLPPRVFTWVQHVSL